MKVLQFVRYIETCATSPDWLDKFHSFFSASFLLAKESERLIFLGIFCNLLVQSFLDFQSRFGCFVKIIRNGQRQNIVSIPSILVTPLKVVIRTKGLDKYSQTQRTVHQGEFRLHH